MRTMSGAAEGMDRNRFIQELVVHVPEAEPVVEDHHEFYEESLLHLLVSDLLRLSVQLFHAGELDAEQRLVGFMGESLRRGDEDVVNAVAFSFVEHVGAAPGETPEYVASWPRALLDERERQLGGQPGPEPGC